MTRGCLGRLLRLAAFLAFLWALVAVPVSWGAPWAFVPAVLAGALYLGAIAHLALQ